MCSTFRLIKVINLHYLQNTEWPPSQETHTAVLFTDSKPLPPNPRNTESTAPSSHTSRFVTLCSKIPPVLFPGTNTVSICPIFVHSDRDQCIAVQSAISKDSAACKLPEPQTLSTSLTILAVFNFKFLNTKEAWHFALLEKVPRFREQEMSKASFKNSSLH